MDFPSVIQKMQVGDALGFQCLACRIGWIETPTGPSRCVVCHGSGSTFPTPIRVEETCLVQPPTPEKLACPPCARCEGRGWVRDAPRAPEERLFVYDLWPVRLYRTDEGTFTVGFIHLNGFRTGTPPRMRTVKVDGGEPYVILPRY